MPALASAALLLSGLFLGACFLTAPAVSDFEGELPHEVYVWQRRWNGDVAAAVRRCGPRVAGFAVLAAEVSWQGGRPKTVRPAIRYDALRAAARPVALVLRIGPYRGPFRENDGTARLLCRLSEEVIRGSRAAGIEPAELQLDFDCAESKLNGYRRWVRAIRRRVAPTPLTITALPCWLDRFAFRSLARETSGFVLQVHSLERPTAPDTRMTLCDPAASRRWIGRAARVCVPFRVALPTYGYLAAFDRNGRFLGLSAEGPSRSWGPDVTVRAVRADPRALARLVRWLAQGPPAGMRGVIWYRMPVRRDRLNWRWPTLAAVMDHRGPLPRADLSVEALRPQPALTEIILRNAGLIDMAPDVDIRVTWSEGRIVSADGLRGFEVTHDTQAAARLQHRGGNGRNIIRPGESWKVGWFRFDRDVEVKINVVVQP